MRKITERGFTIPELLVAIVVVGALLSVSLFLMRPVSYTTSDQNAERQLNMAALAQGLQRYKAKNGTFPTDIPTAKAAAIGTPPGSYNICPYLVPTFLKSMPLDPNNGIQYTGDTTNPSFTNAACNVQGVNYVTGFAIQKNSDGSVTLTGAVTTTQEIRVTII